MANRITRSAIPNTYLPTCLNLCDHREYRLCRGFRGRFTIWRLFIILDNCRILISSTVCRGTFTERAFPEGFGSLLADAGFGAAPLVGIFLIQNVLLGLHERSSSLARRMPLLRFTVCHLFSGHRWNYCLAILYLDIPARRLPLSVCRFCRPFWWRKDTIYPYLRNFNTFIKIVNIDACSWLLIGKIPIETC